MQDDALRHGLKFVARVFFRVEMAIRRSWLRLRGEPRYRLGGSCEGCGRCCEAPAVQVPELLAKQGQARAVFLAWQDRVNGFSFDHEDEETGEFVFRCTHFDRETRRCDSYASRPGICRDYPRVLLFQPWPDLFEECGHRALDRKGDRMARALEETNLDAQALAELKRKLRVQ